MLNYTMLYLLLTVSSAFVIYIFLSKRKIKHLTDSNIALQMAGNKILFEYHNLTDQYRLLVKVQEILKRPTKNKK